MSSPENFELRFSSPSLRMRIGEWVVGKQNSDFKDASQVEAEFAKRPPPVDAPMPEKFNTRFQVERWTAEEQEVVTLHPKAGKGEWHILYFHGGGFALPMFKEHWPLVAAMIDATGASISVPLYKVVPENDYHPANRLMHAAYEKIAGEWGDERVALCGDSAGGNMALSLAIQRRDAGQSLPGRIIPFAPWLDLGMADPATRAIEKFDVMLGVDPLRVMGKWWAGDRPVDHPHVSPLYAELSGLPPIAIFQGRHDIFVVDCRTFADKARDAGDAIKLYEYEGGPHVYMALTFTREAKDTFKLVKQFLDDGV